MSVQGPGPAALIQATPGGPPTAPEGLSAAPGDRQAVLSWSAPENDGGSAVTGYEVRHAEGATVPANTAWTSVGLVTTHTVTGLDNGELHSFEVRAVSARGGGRAARDPGDAGNEAVRTARIDGQSLCRAGRPHVVGTGG